MTTIIAIIIAVVLLVALGKIFSKDASGPSSQRGAAPDSGESSSLPEKDKKNQSVVKNKGSSMSSDIGVKGASLFRPPPEPTLFTGPGCVKTQITDVILRDKFSLFYNSRSSYFELADFVDTDSIL